MLVNDQLDSQTPIEPECPASSPIHSSRRSFDNQLDSQIPIEAESPASSPIHSFVRSFDNQPDGQTPIEAESPACWRLAEVESAVKRGDFFVLARIARYRPFNDEFIDFRNNLVLRLKRPLDSERYVPKLDLVRLLKNEETGFELLNKELRRLFLSVPFDAWVQKSLGLCPQSIDRLEISLFRLSNQLRRCTNQEKSKIAEIVKKVISFLGR